MHEVTSEIATPSPVQPMAAEVAAGSQRGGEAGSLWESLGAGLALANLYMLSVWDDLHDSYFAYYTELPYQTWPIFGSAVGKLILLGLVFWLLLSVVERMERPLARKIGCAAFAGVFVVGLDVARVKGLHWYGDGVFRVLGKNLTFIVLGVLVCAGIYAVLVHERAVVREIRRVLSILLLLVPLNLVTTGWAIHTTWPPERYAAQKPLPVLPLARQAPRFIWVIFDEWDQHLTFRERAPGLALPEVDRFRAEALYGETVFSPARNTLESLPSLVTGRLVGRTQPKAPDDLQLTFSDSGETGAWSKQTNVFQRARALGVNSALVGFYHPYQRILGKDVTWIHSAPLLTLHEHPVYWEGLSGARKISLYLNEYLYRIPLLSHFGVSGVNREKRIFSILYKQALSHALELVAKPELGLVLLHLSIPHPPPIYDRASAQITDQSHGNYSDNLALLDRTLAELRRTMEDHGQWDNSFVLLTSDHPLRRSAKVHPWIPFLLKSPGQKNSIRYTPPFNSVLTQDLILATQRGEVSSGEDAAAWLNTARSRFPTTASKP